MLGLPSSGATRLRRRTDAIEGSSLAKELPIIITPSTDCSDAFSGGSRPMLSEHVVSELARQLGQVIEPRRKCPHSGSC